MPPRAPRWWYAEKSLWPALLGPAALIWDAAARLRWAMTRPYRADVPVICVGNFTSGGAGKTPAAISLARLLIDAGESPVFLTRGYGGRVIGPHLVERGRDSAGHVGDEALLLARIAPVIVAANRAAGARLAVARNASVIVMDDGFQNPGIVKDLSLVVVDRSAGVGNGRVIPAGPLRAGLGFQLARAHALILVGDGTAADALAADTTRRGLPLLPAEIMPRGDTNWLKAKPAIAYAGIGNPEKFFRLLGKLGCEPVHRQAFPDHHPFTSGDADELLALASRHRAQLVTTEKDMARLEGAGSLERLRKASRALPVSLRFKDQGKVKRLLAGVTKPL